MDAFEQWFQSLRADVSGTTYTLLRKAWEDATATERERCAQVAERTLRLHPMFTDGVLQQSIAFHIRSPANLLTPVQAVQEDK